MSNETKQPEIGDRVFMTYGAMCGEDYGTVVEKKDSDFGPSWRVELDDKPEQPAWISRYVGTAEDRGGYYVPREHAGIGTYVVTAENLSTPTPDDDELPDGWALCEARGDYD